MFLIPFAVGCAGNMASLPMKGRMVRKKGCKMPQNSGSFLPRRKKMSYFNNVDFNNYYLNKSKYEYKQSLLTAFYNAWYNSAGWFLTESNPNVTQWIKKAWKADLKKQIKIKLQGQNYTPAAINGIFKACTDWNKANP